MRSLLAAAGVAAALIAPAGASADSTLTESFGQYTLTSTTAGEVNDYLLAFDPVGLEFVFTERAPGELLDTGVVPGCSGDATAEIRCPWGTIQGVILKPGPGDDAVAGDPSLPSGVFYDFQGGDGDDTLDGSQLPTLEARGDAGSDTITPARRTRGSTVGFSLIVPGPGSDTVQESVAQTRVIVISEPLPDGNDRFLGGAGLDEVEYESRAERVEASANGVADDGEAGEGDDIAPSVEVLRSGDGNDLLIASSSVDAQLSGYGGNDELRGGPGDDVLFGGEGDDQLVGNAGDDVFPNGDQRFISVGGGPSELGADVFSGGAGSDTVDFDGRTAPVAITLDGQANDGEATEGDDVRADVETLIGGQAGDTITGTAAAERIVGGAGADTIDDGGGSDHVRGGGHDDTIRTRDATADDVGCGSGTDTLIGDDVDTTDGTCETADLAIVPPPLPPDTTAPAVTVSKCKKKLQRKAFLRGVRCTVTANESATWTVVLLGKAKRARIAAKGDLELARKSFSGTGRSVRLKAAKKLVRGSRRFRVRLVIVATDAAGNQAVRTRRIRVR